MLEAFPALSQPLIWAIFPFSLSHLHIGWIQSRKGAFQEPASFSGPAALSATNLFSPAPTVRVHIVFHLNVPTGDRKLKKVPSALEQLEKNVMLTHNSTPDVRRGRGCVIKVDWGMLRELRVWRKRIRSDDRQTDKWTNRTSTYRLDPRKGSSKNQVIWTIRLKVMAPNL